jgi:hypothetical protein
MKSFREHITETASLVSSIKDTLSGNFDVEHAPHCDRNSTRGQGLGVKITVKNPGDKPVSEHHKDAIKSISKKFAHTGSLYATPSDHSFHMTVWHK